MWIKMGKSKNNMKNGVYISNKKSTQKIGDHPFCCVDKVDNYLERSASPISTTFPAPMVINKSPFIHFFDKNFSISSKEGK